MFSDEDWDGDPGLEDQAGHDVRVPVAASPDPNEIAKASPTGSGPDPTKPYPNPEREAEEQLKRDLIDYRRSLRDFLHDTHTEEE